MNIKFNQSFKLEAVKKALSRSDDTTLKNIAERLGVGYSTLSKWIAQSKKHQLDVESNDYLLSELNMKHEKRPQDWTLEERFNIVVTCMTMMPEQVNEHCRQRGVYSHHIDQWRSDFTTGNTSDTSSSHTKTRAQIKTLRTENNTLKKELNRKDKALAETAALLVLQKKARMIWGNDEGNLR